MESTGFSKSFYKIKEVAEIIGVPQTTLRFWEKEFPELSPKRSLHNQRVYSPRDLELLQIIHFLLYTKGLKLDAAKECLHRNRDNISKKMEVISQLTKVRDDLELLLKSLNLRHSNN